MKRKLKKHMSLVVIMTILATLIIVFTPTTVLADDGTPFPGPSAPVIPATIQAEDFNSGGQDVGYYDTTTGNSGDSTYRSTDVDLYSISGNVCVYMNGNNEWLKYTFHVNTSGWYKVSVNYKGVGADNFCGGLIQTIDNRCYSSANAPASGVLTDYDTIPAVYLTSGDHVYKISSNSVYLNSITFFSISAPQALSPKVVTSSQVTDEYVVADAQVTDSPYNADSTGTNDSTTAIQSAIDDVWKMGGGTVFIPAGKYKVNGTLKIKENVTLRGDWKSPLSGGSGNGTILMASSGLDNVNGTPFISFVGQSASVCFLSIWYPDQHYSSGTIHPYPWTISTTKWQTHDCTISNITLYNSYKGINIDSGSATTIYNVYGTCLNYGILFDYSWEFSFIHNIDIENSIWENAPTDVITNAPALATDRNSLDDYTSDNRIALQISHADGVSVYGITAKESMKDVIVKTGGYDSSVPFGTISKVTGDTEIQNQMSLAQTLLTDQIPVVDSMSYTFALNKKSAKSTMYNVKISPYNAKGDGITDDTGAIQNALNAAYDNGGGIVYLPQGTYKISTHLVVPENVELRGPYGSAHPYNKVDTCTLLAYEGKGTSDPWGATPFIELKSNAGVRGLNIIYPEQGYGTSGWPVYAYPSTIKGNGSGCWVIDIYMANSYTGVNFASNRCDDHLIRGLCGLGLEELVVVGGGSQNGVIEKCLNTYGQYYTAFDNWPYKNADITTLYTYTLNNATTYKIYDSTNETGWGNDTFTTYGGFDFSNATSCILWDANSDVSKLAFNFQNAGNIKIVGAGCTSGEHGNDIFETASNFTGTASIYGYYTGQMPASLKNVRAGTLNFYYPHSLTYNKSATANGYTGGDTPSKGVDADHNSKWTYAQDGSQIANWLKVDLGQPCEVNAWYVRNDGIVEGPSYNTQHAEFQQSDDGINFTSVGSFSGNSKDLVFNPLTSLIQTRYPRLVVYEGTQAGGDNYARIAEFELYGREGWHFDTGTEGWFSQGTVSALTTSNGRLIMTSTGTDPQIVCQDNVNVNASIYKKVKVKLKNGTNSTFAQLYWITTTDGNWNGNKSANLTVTANDPLYTEYTFDLTNNSYWAGTIRQIRLDPSLATGSIKIEYIKFEP